MTTENAFKIPLLFLKQNKFVLLLFVKKLNLNFRNLGITMTDKRTIIGLVLIFLIFMGYMWWTTPSAEEREAIQQEQQALQQERLRVEDSLRIVQQSTAETNSIENNLESVNDSVREAFLDNKKNELGYFSNSYGKEEKLYHIKNDVFNLTFSNKGGRVVSATLNGYDDYNQEPVRLIDAETSSYNLAFFTSDNRVINSEKLVFELLNEEQFSDITISEHDSLTLQFRAYINSNEEGSHNLSRFIEFQYVVYGNQYMVGHSIRMEGLSNVIQNSTPYLDLNWNNELVRQEKNQKNERALSSVYYKPTNDKVDNLQDGRDGNESLKTPLKWVSHKQQFFSYTLIAKDQFANADIEIHSNVHGKDAEKYLCDINTLIGIPYQHGDNFQFDMSIYMGPNKYKVLSKYDLDLERQIPLGWGFFLLQWVNRFAIIPVFNFLEQFGWNYGLIILILTILVKIVLFPIANKSYKSSAIMKVLQPDIAEINKKYPKQEQAMEKSKATMALYKKAGASPMSGCIPMLLQFPILIAMFRFFPASIELRHQPFLWADDLSSYDSILDLPFNIPFYGAHVSLFCLLMSAVNLIYTRINMQQTAQTNAMPGMKTMMMIMPIMFLFILNSFSAGLNYYYFLSTCFTILQTWIVRKTINEGKVREKMRLAESKPVKKSKFMQRMEDMQRMSEQQAKKRR